MAIAGGVPVFVDIEPGSFCVDPEQVEAAVTDRTVAIMPVHLYGHPAAMDKIMPIAERHGLKVIEDAAQAVAASLDGPRSAPSATPRCFSFYPTKNSHSIEGGMVVTGDAEIARQIKLLRNQGMIERYKNEVVGLNNRISDVHSAVGRVQLAKLAGLDQGPPGQRRATSTRHLRGVTVPPVAAGAEHVYHQYTVRVADEVEGGRDGLETRLRERGIGSGVYYPIPIHRLPSFQRPDVASRVVGELAETEQRRPRGALAAGDADADRRGPGADRGGGERAVSGGTKLRAGPDRPGHDGPAPRPGARLDWTASSWSRSPTPAGTRTAWPAAGRCCPRSRTWSPSAWTWPWSRSRRSTTPR